MARRKRNSLILEQCKRRLESILSIHAALDLGGGLNVAAFTAVIDDLSNKLAEYNTALSTIDKLGDDVKQAELIAKDMAEKMLLGVGSRYGKNSQEYGMAGGSRRKTSRRLTSSTAPLNLSSNQPIAAASNGVSSNGASNGASSNGTSPTLVS